MIRKNEYFRTSDIKLKPYFAGWSKNTYPKFRTTYKILVCKLHILSSFRKNLGARKKCTFYLPRNRFCKFTRFWWNLIVRTVGTS